MSSWQRWPLLEPELPKHLRSQYFWAVLAKYFVERPSICVCLMLFSWLDWVYGFLGKIPQKWSALLNTSHHFTYMWYHWWCSSPSLVWYMPGFSPVKVTIFSFLYFILWKQVTKSSPLSRERTVRSNIHLMEEGVCTYIIWNSVRKICLFSPIYWLINLFNHSYQYGLMSIILYFELWSSTVIYFLPNYCSFGLRKLFQVVLNVPLIFHHRFVYWALPDFLVL